MGRESMMERLEEARDLILTWSPDQELPGAETWGEYKEKGEGEAVAIGDAMVSFDDGRILVCITELGYMAVRQNWSEVGEKRGAVLEVKPSEAGRAAHRRITRYLKGRMLHPPVEWTIEFGPWVIARMEGRKILEAGVTKGPESHVIFMEDGQRAENLEEAERLLGERYPQYVPIALDMAKLKSR